MNKDFLIVVCENDPVNKPDWADDFYYELRYRISDDGFAVASSGWDQSNWQQIKNNHILILDRKSLESEIIQLQSGYAFCSRTLQQSTPLERLCCRPLHN